MSAVKGVKVLGKEHVCIHHGHKQHCGEGQGRWALRDWVGGGGKGGKWGTSAVVSTMKNLNKKKGWTFLWVVLPVSARQSLISSILLLLHPHGSEPYSSSLQRGEKLIEVSDNLDQREEVGDREQISAVVVVGGGSSLVIG